MAVACLRTAWMDGWIDSRLGRQFRGGRFGDLVGHGSQLLRLFNVSAPAWLATPVAQVGIVAASS